MQTFSCSFKSNSASFPYSIHTLYFPWNELVNLATKSCYTKNSWPLDSSIYSWLGKMLTLHTNSRFILLFTQWSNRKSYRLRNPRNNWPKQQEADCQQTTRAKDLHCLRQPTLNPWGWEIQRERQIIFSFQLFLRYYCLVTIYLAKSQWINIKFQK